MCIDPGQGLTTPWGRNFYVNRNIFSLLSFIASFKKISLKSDFIQFFFMILYMYIAPGQGQTAPRYKVLMSTEIIRLDTSFICGEFQINFFEV